MIIRKHRDGRMSVEHTDIFGLKGQWYYSADLEEHTLVSGTKVQLPHIGWHSYRSTRIKFPVTKSPEEFLKTAARILKKMGFDGPSIPAHVVNGAFSYRDRVNPGVDFE